MSKTKPEISSFDQKNSSKISSKPLNINSFQSYFEPFALSRKINIPYAQYSIPTEIRQSVFPYFLNTPKKAELFSHSPEKTKKTSTKTHKKGKFLLQLPNKAFKKKKIVYNALKPAPSNVAEKITIPLQERRFSAIKKTIPLRELGKKERVQEALIRVLKHEEINKSSNQFSGCCSISRSISFKKARRITSPLNSKLKRDFFAMSPSQFSLKSSLNLENLKKKNAKEKDHNFLELYLNSFEESPENKMKASFSKVNSPLLQPNANSGILKKTNEPPSATIKLNKVEFNSENNNLQVISPAKEQKKRTDHNFVKILLHYWKFEEKQPRNRPKLQKKQPAWNRKINFSNVRKSLLELLTFLSKCNVNLTEFKENKIFPEKPYQLEGSYIFFKATKYGNYESVKKMIEKNKYYIMEYDYMEQTALHWAAIKGHEKIAILLLEKGAYVDHIDKSNRNPLYYAIRNSNYSIANLLLYYQASPWSSEGFNLKELTTNKQMLSLLKFSRQIHMCLKFTPPRLRNLVWKKEREKMRNFFPQQEF